MESRSTVWSSTQSVGLVDVFLIYTLWRSSQTQIVGMFVKGQKTSKMKEVIELLLPISLPWHIR